MSFIYLTILAKTLEDDVDDENKACENEREHDQSGDAGGDLFPTWRLEEQLRRLLSEQVHRYSRSSSAPAPAFFSSWMFRPRPRISLQSTSKLTGVPASSVFWPFTIDS